MREQVVARQPDLLIVALCYAAPAWLLSGIAKILLLWPEFSRFTERYPEGYKAAFFGGQLALLLAFVVYFSARYTSALWAPRPVARQRTYFALLFLLPLLCYHLSHIAPGLSGVLLFWHHTSDPEFVRAIASSYQKIWGPLAYGTLGTGVILSSVLSFIAPVMEEAVFNGFLANRVLRKWGFRAAVLVVPVCFALCHAPQFGWGPHLISIFFAGLTYFIIRVYSGSLLLSVGCHCAINFVIFLPKWLIAILYFKTV